MHTWYFMLLPLRPITVDAFLLYPLWWLHSVGWMVPPHMVVVAMTLITLPNSTDFGTTPRYGRNSRSPLIHGWIYFTEVLTWQQIAYTCICSISWWKGPKMQRCLSTHRQLETKRRQISIDLRVPDYLLCRSGDSYDVKVLGNQLYSKRTPFRNMCNHNCSRLLEGSPWQQFLKEASSALLSCSPVQNTSNHNHVKRKIRVY